MSAEKKIVLELTQAEAAILLRVCRFMWDCIMEPVSANDSKALRCAQDKIDQQLAEIKGRKVKA